MNQPVEFKEDGETRRDAWRKGWSEEGDDESGRRGGILLFLQNMAQGKVRCRSTRCHCRTASAVFMRVPPLYDDVI